MADFLNIEIPLLRPNHIIDWRHFSWRLLKFGINLIICNRGHIRPQLHSTLFVLFLVPFKASIGISEVENYLPVINRQQNNLTDYNAKNLRSTVSFNVPVRSLTFRTTFKWTHNGAVLVAGNSSRVYVNSSNGALNIFNSTLEDEGAYQFFTSNELGTMFARKFWMKFAGDFIVHWFPLDVILSLRPLIMTIMIMSVFWSSFFSLWSISLPHHTHQPHYDSRRALRSSLPPAFVQLPWPRIRLDFCNGASHFKQLGASNRYGTKRRSALFICWCKWLWHFYEPKKWNIKPSEMQSTWCILRNRASRLFSNQQH